MLKFDIKTEREETKKRKEFIEVLADELFIDD